MIATITGKNEKNLIREEMNRKRNAMPEAEAESKSTAIEKRLIAATEYQKAHAVMFYAAKENEVQTRRTIEAAIKEGKTVLLPITNTERKEIEAGAIENYDNDLKKGAFGLMEPKKKRAFDERKIDVVIVPGLAFDIEGHRLGYGLGYYDKLLHRLANAAKIGLAYDFQVVGKLPRESHDHPMDMIVTESRVIRCN